MKCLITLRIQPEERVSRQRLVGLLLGLGGVVLLVGIDVTGSVQELVGAIGILLATCGYAIGSLIIQHRLSACDPRSAYVIPGRAGAARVRKLMP